MFQLADVMTSAAKIAVTEDRATAAEYIQGELSLFVPERFIPAMQSPYANQFALIDDYRRILSPLTRSVLETLSGEPMPSAAENQLLAKTKMPFLEITSEGHSRIYNVEGELLCDAILNNDALGGYGIEEGWAKTERYVGEFKDGERHGLGCSYSSLEHRKLFEGQWEENKPKAGIQFHTVFQRVEREDSTYKFEELFQYWDEYHLRSTHVMNYIINRTEPDKMDALDDLYVGDAEVTADTIKIDDENLVPLEQFMEKEDPEAVERYQRYCADIGGDEEWEADEEDDEE